MKTIFITIYDGDTEKVILRSGVYAHVKAAGHRIVLIVRGASRIDYYREAFQEGNTIVELAPPDVTLAENLWYHVSWNTVPTRSVALRIRVKLHKGGKLWRAVLESLAWLLGHARLWRESLRFVYGLAPDDFAGDLFERYKPDLLFAPNMFSPLDFRMLRAAHRRGVPTVTTAKSWDVLTTKAFTRVRADKLLVFNEFNRNEAITPGDYDESRVVVTGFPQFDSYANPPKEDRRAHFFDSLKLDPTKRLILMGIPGDWLTPYTHEILTELDRRIEEGAFKEPVQILARLHPKYPDSSEKYAYRHVILERPGTHLAQKREFSIDMGVGNTYAWTFTDHDIEHLKESLYFSDVVVNTASTITLDAAALDKPVILIAYDGDHKLPPLESIALVYERDHFKHVVDTKAAPLVTSNDELVAAIERFLADPNYLRAERDNLRTQLLYKIDGGAAKRTADAVLEMLPK
jgi:hypothetical protein